MGGSAAENIFQLPGLARAAQKGREIIFPIGASGAFGKVINGWIFPPRTMDSTVYPLTRVDAPGKPLDGANKYTMTFPFGGLPKVSEFWSLLRS